MTYRTTRDIVIPAGTEVGPAPRESRYLSPHGDVVIGFDKNTTGTLRMDLEEAERAGVIQKTDDWGRPL